MSFWLGFVMMGLSAVITGCGSTEGDPGGSGSSGGAGGSGGSPVGGMDTGGSPPICVDYDEPTLYGPPVTFLGDVMPIFQARCNIDDCHGTGAGVPDQGLLLGPPQSGQITQMLADQVHAFLVNFEAAKATMNRVTPGEASQSFLMIKLDHPTPVLCIPNGVQCKGVSCGGQMPAGSGDPPSEADKTIIRTWIRDGAVND